MSEPTTREDRRLAMAALNNLIRDTVEAAFKLPLVTPADVERVLGEVRMEVRAMVARCEPIAECGMRDGDYGCRNLPSGHAGKIHREIRDGKLWAEWREMPGDKEEQRQV